MAILWDRAAGAPLSVRGADLGAKGPYSAGRGLALRGQGRYAEDAVAVMDNLAGVFRIADAAQEFSARKTQGDALGFNHVRLQQRYRGLAVVGGEVIVHFNKAGRAYEVNGRYLPQVELGTAPTVDAAQAVARAQADLKSRGKPAGAVDGIPELVIHARTGLPRLAHELTLIYRDGPAGPGRWRYWMDALSGAVIERFNDIQFIPAPTANGFHSAISGSLLADEGGGVTNFTGWYDNANTNYYLYNTNRQWMIENVAASGYPDANTYAYRATNSWGASDPAEVSAALNFHLTQAYFAEVHGLNSFNDAGLLARANMHEGVAYVNAYWDGSEFYFGDGDGVMANCLATLDICGHEYAHAVTEYSANLVYSYESGALNESFSDVFGSCVEFFGQSDDRASYPARNAGLSDWLCGEDCWLSSTALRDMRNPANAATVGVGNEQPTRYLGTYWYTGAGDNGGVHQNSGVQNFFFYLLCEGGSGNNDGIAYSVAGIGLTNAQRVAYRALTVYCTANTGYQAVRSAWSSAAMDLDAAWAGPVGAAWDAVGVQAVAVSPVGGVSFSGSEGGPFSPASFVFTIENSDVAAAGWGVSHTQAWVSVAPATGTIPALGVQAVTVTVQGAAFGLPPGNHADTLVFTNSASASAETRPVTLLVLPPSVYQFPLDADPGWTTQGEWAFGAPAGQGGADHGFPDPSSGASGANVYGVNLNGDYSLTVGGPYYLTAGPLDFSAFTNVSISFQRWLNTDYPPYAETTIQASSNGADWVTIWTNPASEDVADSDWTFINQSLAGQADRQAAFYLRWGYEIGSGAWAYSGWNLDDVTFYGQTIDDLHLSPGGGLEASGYQGGPFAPSDLSYVLSNASTNTPLSWSASSSAAWVTVAPASGLLPPGAGITSVVALTSAVDSFAPGVHTASILFSNATSGFFYTRPVHLEVLEPLVITPAGGLTAHGYQGGPFTPSNVAYVLSNAAGLPQSWTARVDAAWLSVQPAGGLLSAGGSVTATLALAGSAPSLTTGVFTASALFSNRSSGVATTRPAQLTVAAIPGEIAVHDSVPPATDLLVPFGSNIATLARVEHLTITNSDLLHDLVLTRIGFGEFSENFNDGQAQGWIEDLDANWEVIDGEYRAMPAGVEWAVAEYGGKEWSDVTAQVSCRRTGAAGNSAALILRATPGFDFEEGSAYIFQIAESGSYGIWKQVAGAFSWLQSWTTSSAIHGGTNVLLASAQGSALSFSINGTLVWSGTDSSIAGGYIGLGGYSIAGDPTHYFDNLRAGEASTLSAALSEEQAWCNARPAARSADPRVAPAAGTAAKWIGAVTLPPGGWSALAQASGPFRLTNEPASFPHAIPPQGAITFDVIYQPMSLGSNSAEVIIESNDADESNVVVQLTGFGVDDHLGVTPGSNLVSSGHLHGPFAPDALAYTVSNSSAAAIGWTAAHTQSWISLSVSNGALAGLSAQSVVVSINSQASSLPEGVHGDTVLFSNVTTSITTTRRVQLTVFTSPQIQVTPASFNVTNLLGGSKTGLLQVANGAGADGALTFSARTRNLGASILPSFSGFSGQPYVPAAPPVRDFSKPAVGHAFVPGQLLVRFAPGLAPATQAAMLAGLGGASVERTSRLVAGLAVVNLPRGMTVEQALPAFNRTVGIVYAEPNYLQYATETLPNDPRFSELWGMHNTGQNGGVADADIDAPEAWDLETGDTNIIVAVIDTGIDYAHPDLAANMWRNPGEIPANLMDDDGNGYTDDVYGVNAILASGNPMDDHGHGTHCSGTIGGTGNNSTGVVGVCWRVRLMGLKFLDSSGSGSTDDAITCIEYGTLMGARVLNNSWGGGGYSQALKDAIDAAGAAEIVFAAAAGNEGRNTDTTTNYPSGYLCSNIIAVMSVDNNDQRSSFSNYGQETVDLAAPGGGILSCQPGGGYQLMSGTSMATPHVAGACGLLLSSDPSLTVAEIRQILMSTVDPTVPGQCVSGGRMNIARAVAEVGADWLLVAPLGGTNLPPGSVTNLAVSFLAAGLNPGVYSGEVVIACNDRTNPVVHVPVAMTVLPDDLHVQPGSGLVSSGYSGGPFLPSNAVYQVANAGTAPLSWAASCASNWVTVAPAGGALIAGTSNDVVVSLNALASGLAVGIHQADVLISNVNSGVVHVRAVRVTVMAIPDSLFVSPTNGLTSAGAEGGPFLPSGMTYAVSNFALSSYSLDWTARSSEPWVSISPAGGTLAPGAFTNALVAFNSLAETLPSGPHQATIVFSNVITGVLSLRTVSLTVGQADYFTQLFAADNDLDFTTLTFTPNGSANFYAVCRTTGVAVFPTDPTGGTVLTLDDDDSVNVSFTGGLTVPFYGTNRASLYVGSNGYLTFDAADYDFGEALADHFGRIRIAALFDDLNPLSGGNVSWKQEVDRVAVTYQGVPEYGSATATNSFQIELFTNGVLRVTWLTVSAVDGLAGLSRGGGQPVDFVESDLAGYAACGGSGTPPVLALIGGQVGLVSNLLSFAVTATPTEGDAVMLNLIGPPAGAFLSSTNASGTFYWTPPVSGVYTMSVEAADANGATSEVVTLTVQGLRAVHGTPVLTADPPGENAAGDAFDLSQQGGAALTVDQGGFGSFGYVYVNYDATNLYLGGHGMSLPAEENAAILFLSLGTLSDDRTNLWDNSGAPQGLDFLHNLGFAAPVPDIAIVLGDEHGDGTFPSFNLGNGYDMGQGVFALAPPAFGAVPGSRLSQFDGTLTNAAAGEDDDGNRSTDRWECSIPWTSLNAIGMHQVGTCHVAGVIVSSSTNGADRYLSGNVLARERSPSIAGNYGFSFVTLTPIPVWLGVADSDGDALPDEWELQHYLSLTGAVAGVDTDGDGFSSEDELRLGTQPTNLLSGLFMRSVAGSNGQTRVTWLSVGGRSYQLEVSEATPYAFHGFTNATEDDVAAGVETTETLVDPGSTNRARAYRIRLDP